MVEEQLVEAFDAECRSLLELRARLAPRRRREAQVLARLARETRRARADVRALRSRRDQLQKKLEVELAGLATATAPAAWGWLRLGRPATVITLSVAFATSLTIALASEPAVALSSLALFAMGLALSSPPRPSMERV